MKAAAPGTLLPQSPIDIKSKGVMVETTPQGVRTH